MRGPQVVLPFINPKGQTVPELTPVGPYACQLFPYVKFSQTHVNGIDADFAMRFDLQNAGHLTGSLNYSHRFHYIFGFGADSFDLAGTHGPEIISGGTGNPKDRATASLSWDKGPANLTLSVNYVGHFNLTDPSIGLDSCDEALNSNFPRFATGVEPTGLGSWCTVSHFTTFNLYGQYNLSGHLSLHASVLTLFDTPPPLDLQTYGGSNGSAYDPSLHQAGAVGRFFNVGFNYQF